MSCENVSSVKLVDYQAFNPRLFSQSHLNNRTSCTELIINKLQATFGECVFFALIFWQK